MLDTLTLDVLGTVRGGVTVAPGPKPPDNRTWIDRLPRAKPGDDGMVKQPKNPGMDPGIHRPWNPFAPPPRERSA
jgi:hypothetical protein